MLFRKDVLGRVARGEVTLAFRRWKRPTVKPGGRLRTPAGVVRIGEVSPARPGDVTNEDAQRAGYAGRVQALSELGGEERGALYRVELQGIEPDDRVSLRARDDIPDAEWAALRARFDRWEKGSPGYHRAVLRSIRERPETAARILAEPLGVDKPRFKRDVRMLKELGLTESLDIGYRLSPRGEAVLTRLDAGL